MKKLRFWLASESGKRFFNIAYSLGAAIVIVGAMFKVMHFPGANVVFVTGMIVEALIFFLSAFDTSLYDNAPVAVGQNIQMSDNIMMAQSGSTQPASESKTTEETSAIKTKSVSGVASSSGGGSQVIIVGGGTGASGNTSPSNVGVSSTTSTSTENIAGHAQGPIVAGGVVGGGYSGSGASSISPETAKDYSDSMATAAQNMEEFSKTMQSLNETSQTLLDAYKQIADANNLSESMNTVRYINDSLSRIKSLYDGAIGDSYMFKEEMSKMTRHIEALNQVYARLLQAMTSNNNPNHNNPPIY